MSLRMMSFTFDLASIFTTDLPCSGEIPLEL